MESSEEWWTAPVEADNGNRVMVTVRDDVDKYRLSGKYTFRIEVTWRYGTGFPDDHDATLMEQATDRLTETFRRDKIAVMTGIYTGDGQRDWIFYTKNLHTFGLALNRALADMEQLPLLIEAYEDPEWEEYTEINSGH